MRSAVPLAALGPGRLPARTVDAVYCNGRSWTGDASQPAATALAVEHGRLRFVGSDRGGRAVAGATTRLVDREGRRVVPGCIDSHWHLSTTSRAGLTDAGAPDSMPATAFEARINSRDTWKSRTV